MEVLGDVINATRPKDISELLAYPARHSGMRDGMKVLDCGSGVCGPAIYFASNFNVDIECLNLSEVQLKIAREKIKHAHLKGSINLTKTDYNLFPSLFKPETFDLVYFIEAFCYCRDPNQLLVDLYDVIKPGGTLYIKDLFLKDDLRLVNPELHRIIVKKINDHYATQLTEAMNEIENVKIIFERSPFKVEFIRRPLYENDNYLTYAAYQGMNDLVGDINDVFNVIDFFEIKATKPL
jgi:ubiquinone/menaquinone biosynthesis C-methylase UbiE